MPTCRENTCRVAQDGSRRSGQSESSAAPPQSAATEQRGVTRTISFVTTEQRGVTRTISFVTRSLSTKLLLLQHLPHPISVCSALGSDVACIPYPYALLSAQMLHASHILVLCSRLRCGSGGRQGYASRSPLDRIRICSSSRRARRRVRCQSGTSASVSSAPGRSGWSACRAAAGEKR